MKNQAHHRVVFISNSIKQIQEYLIINMVNRLLYPISAFDIKATFYRND
jgi:hypothetical protein